MVANQCVSSEFTFIPQIGQRESAFADVTTVAFLPLQLIKDKGTIAKTPIRAVKITVRINYLLKFINMTIPDPKSYTVPNSP
jgi:hypothetical protein